MSDDVTFTAYPSGADGSWTVWDHIEDEAVREGLPEAEARRLAAELVQVRARARLAATDSAPGDDHRPTYRWYNSNT